MKKMMMWFTWRPARAGVKAGVIVEVDPGVGVTPTVGPGVDHILILHILDQDPEVIDTVTVDLEADPTLIHHTHQGQDRDPGPHQYHVEEALPVSWTEGESQALEKDQFLITDQLQVHPHQIQKAQMTIADLRVEKRRSSSLYFIKWFWLFKVTRW